jgi:hypothetical protein
MKSPFFEQLMTGKISSCDLKKLIKLAKQSSAFKLYNKHKIDDRKRLEQERVIHLHALKQSKIKVVKNRARLANLVKMHGGPCQTPEDVDKLVSGDHGNLMRLLQHELSYQKKVIHGEMPIPSLDELFRIKKLNRVTNKYEQVPLEERISNLKAILSANSGDDSSFCIPIVTAEQFKERADAKHLKMKTYNHRPEEVVEDENVTCNLADTFYADLPRQEYVAVYYNEEADQTPWYIGRIEKVNASDDCPDCKSFPLPECNDNYEYCFIVKFMKLNQKKRKVPKARQQNLVPDRSLWEFRPGDTSLYHVTVSQIVPCKVIVNPKESSSSTSKEHKQSFIVQNVAEIDDFLKCNVLYMLQNS